MSSHFSRRPPDPLVSKNPFRGQSFKPAGIPSFTEAQEQLPTPILSEHPGFVEMYWRAWELIWSRLRRPTPSSGLVSEYCSLTAEDCLSMLRSGFSAHAGLYGRRLFDFMGSLDNFYSRQHDDGFICGELDAQDGSDCFYPFDPDGTDPNVLGWTEWRYFRVTGDDRRLAKAFWPLMAHHRWLRENRTWPDGSYWATGRSSGMDNQLRVPDSAHHHRHWSWIDATMQAALSCDVLGKMALRLEETELCSELNSEFGRLVALVNGRMWQESTGFYKDTAPDGEFSPVKSSASFWCLLAKELVPEKRLSALVQHLREANAFKVDHPIPSQSADSPGYQGESGFRWQGGVWPASNYMVLKGLRNIDQNQLAHEIGHKHLKHVWEMYQHTDTFWDYYAPEAIAPGEGAQADNLLTAGLSAVAMLIEDVIGLNVDWPLRRVTWARCLDSADYWGIRNYPLGPDGRLDLIGNRDKVVVITSVPFTLVLRDRHQVMQSAVPAGTTEIDLT